MTDAVEYGYAGLSPADMNLWGRMWAMLTPEERQKILDDIDDRRNGGTHGPIRTYKPTGDPSSHPIL